MLAWRSRTAGHDRRRPPDRQLLLAGLDLCGDLSTARRTDRDIGRVVVHAAIDVSEDLADRGSGILRVLIRACKQRLGPVLRNDDIGYAAVTAHVACGHFGQ